MDTRLISNGMIVDGSGKPPYKGHVLLEGDRIKAVAKAGSTEGAALLKTAVAVETRADNLAVAPGFIDCHSHFDWVLPLPDHEDFLYPMIEQGITTVVTGNCGFSPAPVPGKRGQFPAEYFDMLLEKPFAQDWENMDEFLQHLEQGNGMLFNMAQQVGHGTVQLAVEPDETRSPDSQQMSQMIALINDSFDSGAIGLSYGLMYPPGIFSPRSDLVAMARAAANRDRVLTVHTRSLSRYSGHYPIIPFLGRPHNLKALDEILSIALEAGVKLQISHFIFVGRKSWSTAKRAFEMIEDAAAKGLQVMWDVYPHFCGNSYLNVFLPTWFQKNLDRNMNNPAAVRRLKLEIRLARFLLGFDMADIWVMDAAYDAGMKFNGMNLVEIAAQEKLDPVDAILKLIRKSDSRALQLTYGYTGDDSHESLMATILAHPRCLFETDTILKSRGFANPASYGAFPRILGHYVRERGVLDLSEAVSKMSAKTARWMGIEERGEIRPGFFADLALFDPDTVADNTTTRDTARRPSGIDMVFINGDLVVENGIYKDNLKSGRVLRCSCEG